MSVLLPRSSSQDTTRYDIPAFIAEIEDLLVVNSESDFIASEVERRLPRLLLTPDLLAPEHRQSRPDRYSPNLVAVAPSGAFSIVALVWLPGQETPIHDHVCWCVVGVLEGVERECRYHLLEGPTGERWLCPGDQEVMTHGATARLVPPDENMHRVSNDGSSLAISIHVYGANLATLATHSSVNECFDMLPIRDDQTGKPVPWRANATHLY